MITIDLLSIKKVSFVDIILVLSVLLVGGFNEWASGIISIALLGYLLYMGFEHKTINFSKDLLFFSVLLICISYFATSLWAVDSGMAFLGGIKFCPLILFYIAFKQGNYNKANTFNLLILTTAAMVIISSIFSIIPQFSAYFTVADRLSGFFQYPNTFAMLVLICELLTLQKEKFTKIDIAYLAIFVFGIIYSGSRITFVLFLISNIIILLLKTNKKTRLIILFSILAVILITFILFNNSPIIQRFFRISIFESTFVGRILYWFDALQLLIKYPFGIGYLGYNYIEPSIQTGVYTVRYVHNDFLQLILDIGWIPTILFMFTIIKKVFSKNTDKYLKITITSFCAHIFFDFDLQFISMFLILILLLDNDDSKIIKVKFNAILGGALALIFAINTYLSIHLVLSYLKLEKQANKLYAYNTENHIALLEKETSLNKANETADIILKQNNTTYIPYVIKSNAACSDGDFTAVITYNRELINRAPFHYENYENYAKILISGIEKYKAANDYESANFCIKELLLVNNALKQLPSRQSALGKAVKDQPKTEFPQEISNYINGLEG